MSDEPRRVLDTEEVVHLWPADAPGMPSPAPIESVVQRGTNGEKPDRAVYGISRPRMTVLRPSRPNGAAVLVMPGGGFRWLAIDKEVYELGPRLMARGYTVFTLLYRLPGEGWAQRSDVALADAQRAIRLVRHGSSGFGVRPDRVVALGFSAGGHVCADLATRFDRRTYAPVDDADELSARPDYAAPIYLVQSMSAPYAHEESRSLLLGSDPSPEMERDHSPASNVSAATPACFLAHAEDDPIVVVENTLLFRQALKDKGVPVETHLFTRGGHGFGLCDTPPSPWVSWPQLFMSWMSDRGLD